MTLHVARPRDLVELAVMGLLSEQPRHPYDMQRELKLRGNTDFVRGLPRSLYHAVDQLVAAGFVEAGETEREGTRPERTVYGITEDGRAEYASRLHGLLARPSDATTFHAALSLIAGLDPGSVLWSLRARTAAVAGEVARLDAVLRGALAQLPRLYLVEVEYLRNQLQAEATWVQAIVDDIEAGRLVWPERHGPYDPDAPASAGDSG